MPIQVVAAHPVVVHGHFPIVAVVLVAAFVAVTFVLMRKGHL
jgi:hypothetical protein